MITLTRRTVSLAIALIAILSLWVLLTPGDSLIDGTALAATTLLTYGVFPYPTFKRRTTLAIVALVLKKLAAMTAIPGFRPVHLVTLGNMIFREAESMRC